MDMHLPSFLKNNLDCPSSFLKLTNAKIDLRGNQFGERFEQIIKRPVIEVTKFLSYLYLLSYICAC